MARLQNQSSVPSINLEFVSLLYSYGLSSEFVLFNRIKTNQTELNQTRQIKSNDLCHGRPDKLRQENNQRTNSKFYQHSERNSSLSQWPMLMTSLKSLPFLVRKYNDVHDEI
jgi:hypothetical protein